MSHWQCGLLGFGQVGFYLESIHPSIRSCEIYHMNDKLSYLCHWILTNSNTFACMHQYFILCLQPNRSTLLVPWLQWSRYGSKREKFPVGWERQQRGGHNAIWKDWGKHLYMRLSLSSYNTTSFRDRINLTGFKDWLWVADTSPTFVYFHCPSSPKPLWGSERPNKRCRIAFECIYYLTSKFIHLFSWSMVFNSISNVGMKTYVIFKRWEFRNQKYQLQHANVFNCFNALLLWGRW